MAAPTAGSDASPAPLANGSGSHGTDSASQGNQASSASDAAAPGERSDYIGRVRANPDLAEQEVRRWQSSATRAENDLKKLNGKLGTRLTPLLESVSGDVLADIVQEYQSVVADPTVASAIRSFRETGQVRVAPPAPGSETDDEAYYTDTERALKRRLDEVQTRADRLEQLVTQQTTNFGRQSLTQHAERIFEEYGLSGDRAEQVRTSLFSQVDQLSRQGEAGRKMLVDLQSPSGRDTVELLVMRALKKEGLFALAREQLLREGKARDRMQTDGPYAFGTADDEPVAEHKTALEALKAVRARPELGARYRDV